MLKLTPDEPIAHYQLATLLKTDHPQEGIAEFVKTEQLNPNLAAAHFQLYNLYRQMGQNDDAQREFQTWQEVKKQQEGAAIAEDVDWCNYAEIYDPPRAVTPVTTATPPVYTDTVLAGKADPKTAGMTLIDATGKGQTDLLVWSATAVDLYAKGATRVPDSGLSSLKGVVFIAPGDFDNDGLMDLCVLTDSGAALYRNTGGKFVKSTVRCRSAPYERAVWIDYDHDYDLDLILLGDRPALMRNQGEAGFAEHTADFPFMTARRIRGRVEASHGAGFESLRSGRDLFESRAGALSRSARGHYEAAAFTGVARDLTQIDADFDARMAESTALAWRRMALFT